MYGRKRLARLMHLLIFVQVAIVGAMFRLEALDRADFIAHWN